MSDDSSFQYNVELEVNKEFFRLAKDYETLYQKCKDFEEELTAAKCKINQQESIIENNEKYMYV